MISLLANAPLSIVIAGNIGPKFYSVISEYLLLSMSGSLLIYFGMESLLVRELTSKSYYQKVRLIYHTIIIRILALLILTFVYFLLPTDGMLIVLLIAAFFDVLFFMQQDLEAYSRFKSVAISRIVSVITISCFRIFGLMYNIMDPNYYIILYVLEKFVFLLVIFFLNKNIKLYLKSFQKSIFNLGDIKKLFYSAASLFITTMLFLGITRVDQYLLYFSGDNISLATYSISTRMIEATYFIPAVFANILMPTISKKDVSFSEQKQLTYIELKKIIIISLLLMPVVWIAGYLVWIYYLYEFLDFFNFVLVYTFVIPSIFTYNILKKLLIAQNGLGKFLRIMCIFFLINLIISMGALFQYGPIALVISTACVFFGLSLSLYCVCFHSSLNRENK